MLTAYAVLVPAEFLIPVELLVAGAVGAKGDAKGRVFHEAKDLLKYGH